MSALLAKRARVLDELVRELRGGPEIDGSIGVRPVRCGKRGCRKCGRGAHGSYVRFTGSTRARTHRTTVSAREAVYLSIAVGRSHRVDRLIRVLRSIDRLLLRMAVRGSPVLAKFRLHRGGER